MYSYFYHSFASILPLLPHFHLSNFSFTTLTQLQFYFCNFFLHTCTGILLLYYKFASRLFLLPHFLYTSSLPHFCKYTSSIATLSQLYFFFTTLSFLLPQLHKYTSSFTTITQVRLFFYHNYTSTLLLLPQLHKYTSVRTEILLSDAIAIKIHS